MCEVGQVYSIVYAICKKGDASSDAEFKKNVTVVEGADAKSFHVSHSISQQFLDGFLEGQGSKGICELAKDTVVGLLSATSEEDDDASTVGEHEGDMIDRILTEAGYVWFHFDVLESGRYHSCAAFGCWLKGSGKSSIPVQDWLEKNWDFHLRDIWCSSQHDMPEDLATELLEDGCVLRKGPFDLEYSREETMKYYQRYFGFQDRDRRMDEISMALENLVET